jgi:hypothetical protein
MSKGELLKLSELPGVLHFLPLKVADSCFRTLFTASINNHRETCGTKLRNMFTCLLFYCSCIPSANNEDVISLAQFASLCICISRDLMSSADGVSEEDKVYVKQILSNPNYFSAVSAMRTDRVTIFYLSFINVCQVRWVLFVFSPKLSSSFCLFLFSHSLFFVFIHLYIS